MAAQISYNSHDYKPTRIVPVIASFDTEGHIMPLYVRIAGEAYRIESFWVRYAFANQIEFQCKIVDGDICRPLALTYYQEENVWGMPR